MLNEVRKQLYEVIWTENSFVVSFGQETLIWGHLDKEQLYEVNLTEKAIRSLLNTKQQYGDIWTEHTVLGQRIAIWDHLDS